jgi:hypothetical protein
VQEALVAPAFEVVVEVGEGGGAVQAHDGVRDVEVVLLGRGGEGQVVCREVPVKVREGLGELVGLVAGEGGD